MEIKKYQKQTDSHKIKTLRFFKDKVIKFVIGYSVSTNGTKWMHEGVGYNFKYLKQEDTKYVARAFVLGKLKFDYIKFR